MSDPRQDFRAAILAALGHAPDVIEPGRFQRFATRERRADTAGWCKLFDDLRGGVFGCYRQGISETWCATDKRQLTRGQRIELARQIMAATAEREVVQRRQWAANAERIAALWGQCVPLVPGDPVLLYLQRRLQRRSQSATLLIQGNNSVPTEVLRMHPALPYWHERELLGAFPAMVAPLTAPDGRIVALHRTYLNMDGGKAEVPTVKKLTAAAGPLAGTCIRIFDRSCGTGGIAEGIETVLAAYCASGVETVAAYCAGNLAAWRWPAGLRRIVIFADADKAGREAAHALRKRAIAARLRCDVVTPDDEGADWCDVWAARGADAIGLEAAA